MQLFSPVSSLAAPVQLMVNCIYDTAAHFLYFIVFFSEVYLYSMAVQTVL